MTDLGILHERRFFVSPVELWSAAGAVGGSGPGTADPCVSRFSPPQTWLPGLLCLLPVRGRSVEACG